MSADIIPAGFSSSAVTALKRTMQSSIDDNTSFLASAAASPLDARGTRAVSGDTLFSIIAVAAKAKAATAVGSQKLGTSDSPWLHSTPGTAPDDAVDGENFLAEDMYSQKSYTTDQSIDIYYGQTQISTEFAKRTWDSMANQSTGTVVADFLYGLKGDQAKSFAAAYDNRTLTFGSPNDAIAGLDLVQIHDLFFSADGYPSGESGGQTFDQTAYGNYLKDHPDSILGGQTYFGAWQGVLISW